MKLDRPATLPRPHIQAPVTARGAPRSSHPFRQLQDDVSLSTGVGLAIGGARAGRSSARIGCVQGLWQFAVVRRDVAPVQALQARRTYAGPMRIPEW